jgi:hypothetical protein
MECKFIIVPPNEAYGILKGYSSITVFNPSVIETVTFSVEIKR